MRHEVLMQFGKDLTVSVVDDALIKDVNAIDAVVLSPDPPMILV
jgi:hypothetical protein